MILRWQSEETILRGLLSVEGASAPTSVSAGPRPRTHTLVVSTCPESCLEDRRRTW